MDEEINILDYLRVVKKHLRMIIALFISTVLVTMVLSLLSPKIYRSTATILPPQEISRDFASILDIPGASRMLGGLTPTRSSDVFVAILKSRTMKDDVINKFKLLDVYKASSMTAARSALTGTTDITTAKDGTIGISVESKDPKLACDIANFYAINLDRLNRKLNITQAKRGRLFIEGRLKETERILKGAEEGLRRFRAEHKLIEIEAQSQAAIEAAARLQGEITAKEVQLRVMEEQATSFHPQVAQLKTEIRELRKRLHNMEYGKGSGHNPTKQLYIPFTEVPSVGLQLARLMREVKVQETVFTLLTQQYEQAKIAEARDTPTVQVLDRAIPAEHKCKPKIKLNMAISGILSLFLGIFSAFFLEYLQGSRKREEA